MENLLDNAQSTRFAMKEKEVTQHVSEDACIPTVITRMEFFSILNLAFFDPGRQRYDRP